MSCPTQNNLRKHFYNSFIHIGLWNSFPHSVIDENNTNAFKNKLDKFRKIQLEI